MKIHIVLALLLSVLVPSMARAQGEDPRKTEVREVVNDFCRAFLDGDSETAIAQIDSRAPEYQAYVRMIPILTSMTHAENELYDALDQHFSAGVEETYRPLDTMTTLPYSILHGMSGLLVTLEEDDSLALLQYPIEGEEPLNIMLLHRVGNTWKIDAGESLGLDLPTNEQEWATWNATAQEFITQMNSLRQEVATFDTPEEFQARLAELVQAANEETGTR